MAEFDELDGRLRDALGRAAEPGDSTGVADAIRSRVSSGDPGFPAAGGTAPGWGGGFFRWMPWLASVIAVGAIGVSLGAFGIIPTPFSAAPLGAAAAVAVPLTADGLDCPAGVPITTIPADSEVLAVERDESGGYVAVRDPRNTAATVWVEVAAVEPKAGQPALDTLPVGGCPVQAVETIAPVVPTEPEETQAPAPPPPPAPGDTTPPSVTQYWAAPTTIYQTETAIIHALAADDVGVTGVAISWSGAASGSGAMSFTAGEWRYSFPRGSGPDGWVTFTLRAVDAAGNLSAPVQVQVYVDTFG